VKEVDGCHWVARPQPLPALEVKRPEVLHESVDGEEDAMDAMDAMDATIELCEEEKEIGNPLRFCFQMYQEVALFILFLSASCGFWPCTSKSGGWTEFRSISMLMEQLPSLFMVARQLDNSSISCQRP